MELCRIFVKKGNSDRFFILSKINSYGNNIEDILGIDVT